ncbi:MAG: hypothetical protein RMN52_00650 [Anaerolineae bacterium]|nr:hypothetical protein [Candidatus Roseilinea sp.]MDW8448486.1 hypothetical protein [Anaerolineae bacterium]
MKKVRTPSQIAANTAARKRALFVAAIAAVVGVIMLLLSSTFLVLHCVVAAAVALSGGIAAARAAIPIERQAFRSAGATGGIYAALGYALPFMIYNFIRYLNVNDQTVAERAAELTPDQIAMMEQFNVVLGAEFFRGQDVSYIFGYLLFALLFGWILGIVGGVLAKRQLA